MSANANKRINMVINNRLEMIGRKPSQRPVHTETDWEFLRRLKLEVNATLPPEGPKTIDDVDSASKRIVLRHQASCLVRNFGWLLQWICAIACTVIVIKFVWNVF